MLTVIVSGLAIGAVYAAAALVYNVMYSTSKVLSVTTGHICMLGGVFGAWFIAGLGLPMPIGLAGAIAVGALFGWLTEVVGGPRRVLARCDEHLWLLSARSRWRPWSSRRSASGGGPSRSPSRA